MNIKIGENIKRFRTERHITQETLAVAIGVTPQAVSRWESEGGYPDIELLPLLADFFAVSTDELLGYNLAQRETEIANAKKELHRLAEVGTHQEMIASARAALVRFPQDAEIKLYLAACLSDEWSRSKEDTLILEAEELCTSVVDDCRDEDVRYDAICTLSAIYSDLKRTEEAKSTLELLCLMKYCRELSLARGIGDENTELYKQDAIDKLTDALGIAITNYASEGDFSNDERIEMLLISNRLYEMIYGANSMFYHVRLFDNYWWISVYRIAQDKTKEALDALEKTCYHAMEYDKSYTNNRGKSYTSLFTKNLTYTDFGEEFHELKESTACHRMLDRLRSERYNSIRDDIRFVAIIDTLMKAVNNSK